MIQGLEICPDDIIIPRVLDFDLATASTCKKLSILNFANTKKYRNWHSRNEMDEMFDDNIFEETDILPVREVWVLDCTNKSRTRVKRLTNFPIAETMNDIKSSMQIFMQDITHPENWEIGYVLARNKKYTIETNGISYKMRTRNLKRAVRCG